MIERQIGVLDKTADRSRSLILLTISNYFDCLFKRKESLDLNLKTW